MAFFQMLIVLGMYNFAFDFNPKARRLFGQLNTRTGANFAHFGKHSQTPTNFILEQQTVYHM
jgi:hypothetical protein